MRASEDKSYKEFFEDELYGGFVNYLINELGHEKVIAILRDRPLISRKGVHPDFRVHFNKFMSKNPLILKRFVNEGQKFMGLRNIAGGELKFPVDTSNENLMLREGLRIPVVIPKSDERIHRPSKGEKYSAKPFSGETLRGERHEKRYLYPKRLTVHFKEGHAIRIGKTTESFMVHSRSEAMNIILDRYEKRVAYATIQNEEQFVFVKPRNGKNKRSRKLRSKIQ